MSSVLNDIGRLLEISNYFIKTILISTKNFDSYTCQEKLIFC